MEDPSGRRGGLARSLGVVEWSAGVVLVAGMVAVPSHPVAGWPTRRGAPLCRAQCPFVAIIHGHADRVRRARRQYQCHVCLPSVAIRHVLGTAGARVLKNRL